MPYGWLFSFKCSFFNKDTLCFEAPHSNDSDLLIEVEADSNNAKILMWELQSGQVGIIGCIMKAADQKVEIKGRAFPLIELEIPVQLQVALTDEFTPALAGYAPITW